MRDKDQSMTDRMRKARTRKRLTEKSHQRNQVREGALAQAQLAMTATTGM